jgi:hypothetical protein
MRFGALAINPATNPAILATATWDGASAWAAVSALLERYWESVLEAARGGQPLPPSAAIIPYPSSCTRLGEGIAFLASLADKQQVFVEIGPVESRVLGEPLAQRSLANGDRLAMYPSEAGIIDHFLQFKPGAGPRAMGAVPRLGIGTRMTTAMWPGIFQAMNTGGFAANTIQNSVRELNLLETLLAGKPAERNTAFNFGEIECGYTGSSFEGLWVSGVLEALKSPPSPPFGADADHIQVKRGPDGLTRAKQLLTACRYYTFFTLDVSDILDYNALGMGEDAEGYLVAKIKPADRLQPFLDWHQQKRCLGGQVYALDRASIGWLVGKYWDALEALQALVAHIAVLKAGRPFDLELSIDEHPPEFRTFDCLTTASELVFLTSEVQRRGLPLTHVAPNFGIEKGTDYRCPDGLAGLEERIRALLPIAQSSGVMIDFHSGDDLSPATIRTIGRATQGHLHFKVSPSLQLLFAEVLADFHPALFRRWWEDALDYARREAAHNSLLAQECVRQVEEGRGRVPSPRDSVFHYYSFAYVGRRDPQGQLLYREEFYDLSAGFYQEYQARLARHLCSLAGELCLPSHPLS